jgi:16S rRNA (uracil1498-N3)-methyltransferase
VGRSRARHGAPPRLHVAGPLAVAGRLVLPAAATRHVQVLRLQPGDPLVLFDGRGGEWRARVSAMARDAASVAVEAHDGVERELPWRITIAVGMPANERMDALVEKATELGAGAIQPLLCARSVLRLAGDRAARRAAHWRAIAIAACEQCGRNRVPELAEPNTLQDWLLEACDGARAGTGVPGDRAGAAERWLLAPEASRRLPVSEVLPGARLIVLSGPEGGFTREEIAAAEAAGFRAVSLGARVLRADTAPLAALAACAALAG